MKNISHRKLEELIQQAIRGYERLGSSVYTEAVSDDFKDNTNNRKVIACFTRKITMGNLLEIIATGNHEI